MNETVLQNITSYTDYLPFWVRGLTAYGQTVYGIHTKTLPGVGFLVSYNKKEYLVINDFGFSLTCPPRLTAGALEDAEEEGSQAEKAALTPQTIRFWLSSGVSTKAILTQEEMAAGKIIDPMSVEGLAKPQMGYPLLSHYMYPNVHITDMDVAQLNDTEHFLQTGVLLPHPPGNMAPKPFSSYIKATLKQLNNSWHLARALRARGDGKRTVSIVNKNHVVYYDFEDDIHALRIQEFTPSNFNTWTIKLPTHPPSCAGSPSPFVLSAAPEDIDILDITGIDETASYPEKLSWLSDEALFAEKRSTNDVFVSTVHKYTDIVLEEMRRL